MKRSQKTILRLCTILGSVSHWAGSRSKTSVSAYNTHVCTSSLRNPIYKGINGMLNRCEVKKTHRLGEVCRQVDE